MSLKTNVMKNKAQRCSDVELEVQRMAELEAQEREALEKRHFPYFIADKELTLSSAVKVYLKPKRKEEEIDTSGLTLKDLVNHKLLKRESFNEIPPRVDYTLTKDGEDLRYAIIPLLQWALSKKGTVVAHCSCSMIEKGKKIEKI